MAKKNFYAVKVGKIPGIYTTWNEAKELVSGYPGAEYKGFSTKEEAEAYLGGAVEKDMPIDEPYAFTDGSFNASVNPPVFGFGGFFVLNGQEYILQGSSDDKELSESRNVAGEVMGAMAAIDKARELGISEFTLYYDYMGIEMWANGSWKTNKPVSVKYKEYVMNSGVRINFVHVKGHSGIPGNERADSLAKEAVGVE